MNIVYKVILTACLFISLEKLTRTQTHAFREEKTQNPYSFQENWEVEALPVPDVLNQPFTFLGSGVQCYAFLSQDQTTVLKVFKHYHFGLNSSILQKMPLTKKWTTKRKSRMESIFSSALIAYRHLPEQTGVFYLNLNSKESRYPLLTIYDKIGVRRSLDLNKTPFLLQKKADLLFPYLNGHKEAAKAILDSLFRSIANRQSLHIVNTDPLIHRNFGVENGHVIEIDVGSFTKSAEPNSRLVEGMYKLKKWIEKNTPELDDYFEEKMQQL